MKCIKYLILFTYICHATSTFQDALDQVSHDVVKDFMIGVDEDMPSLKTVLRLDNAIQAEQLDHDIKEELQRTLESVIHELLSKIQYELNRAKEMSSELIKKSKDIAIHIKEANLENATKQKQMLQKLRENIQIWLKSLQEKFGTVDLGEIITKELETMNLLQGLNNKILERIDVNAITEYMNHIFGHSSALGKTLIQTVKMQGTQSLKELIGEILSGTTLSNRVDRSISIDGAASCKILKYSGITTDEDAIRSFIITSVGGNAPLKQKLLRALEIGMPTLHSLLSRYCLQGPISNAWNKVKDFFKAAGLGLKDKFSVFGNWLKGVMNSGWSKAKDKASQLKEVAQTVIANGKSLTSKAATQAIEFFKEHKSTIGKVVWKQLLSVATAALIGAALG